MTLRRPGSTIVTVTRNQIIEVARSWIGTPYVHQGRKKGMSVDCLGLIWGVSLDLGLPTPEIPSNYTRSPSGNQLILGCEKYLNKVPTGFNYGTIAVFFGTDIKEAQHFAICGKVNGRPTMIHAFSRLEKVVEAPVHRFWERRLMASYEYKGTEG